MKKLLVLFTFAFLTACSQQTSDTSIQTEKPTENTSEQKQVVSEKPAKKPQLPPELEQRMKLQEAMMQGDASACQELDEDLQTGCLDGITRSEALKSGNVETCEDLSTSEDIESCKESVVYTKAKESGDKSACSEIEDEDLQNYCFNKFLVREQFDSQEEEFDCSQMHGQAVKTDCENIKGIFTLDYSQGEPDYTGVRCSDMQTRVFADYCFK